MNEAKRVVATTELVEEEENSGYESAGNSSPDQSHSDGDDGMTDNDEKCHQQIVRLQKKTVV